MDDHRKLVIYCGLDILLLRSDSAAALLSTQTCVRACSAVLDSAFVNALLLAARIWKKKRKICTQLEVVFNICICVCVEHPFLLLRDQGVGVDMRDAAAWADPHAGRWFCDLQVLCTLAHLPLFLPSASVEHSKKQGI